MEGLCGYLPPAFGLGCPVNSSLATDNSDDEASSEKSGNSEDDSRNHYDDGDDLDNNAEEKLKIQREARERFRQVTSTVEVPEKDILAAFARLVETQRETLKRRCFCFFIDGLDEYEENATNRPQRHCESSWQVGQQGQGTIKLCVSTREHNVYMNTFPHAKWLRLHELTYPSRLMAPLGTHGQPPKANVARYGRIQSLGCSSSNHQFQPATAGMSVPLQPIRGPFWLGPQLSLHFRRARTLRICVRDTRDDGLQVQPRPDGTRCSAVTPQTSSSSRSTLCYTSTGI